MRNKKKTKKNSEIRQNYSVMQAKWGKIYALAQAQRSMNRYQPAKQIEN
jgi:hypothetical protein